MTFSSLWAKITGSDKGQPVPNQQVESLGLPEDLSVLFPYGMYADLPNGELVRKLDAYSVVPITTIRPDGINRGEPVFFHPGTLALLVFRNNGGAEIIGDLRIDGDLTVTGDLAVAGNLTVTGDTALGAIVTSNGVNIGATHVHSGVTPGPGTSGPPV